MDRWMENWGYLGASNSQGGSVWETGRAKLSFSCSAGQAGLDWGFFSSARTEMMSPLYPVLCQELRHMVPTLEDITGRRRDRHANNYRAV